MNRLEREAGVHLAWAVDGEGPEVLMIQGVGVPACGWDPQVAGLSDRYRIARYDNRGIGDSSPIAGETSVEELAADALALLDALGWERAHVVGHSLGGVIAQQLALDAPSRVRTLSLLCTFFRGRDGARPRGRMLWVGMRTSIGTRAMRRRAFVEMIVPRSRLGEIDRDAYACEVEPVFGRDLGVRPPGVMKQLRALGRHDASERLGALSGIPTLVVSGEEDIVAPPAQGRALAAAIDGARYVELEGAAHGLTITRTDELHALLDAHFSQG